LHTAICTFDNRDTAQQAVDRLVQAGFERHDIHMEYRHADGSPMTGPENREEPANDAWDGLEREVAVGRDVLAKFAFFERLFGNTHADHTSTYESAADRGHCVVVVDAHDEASAERAQNVLHGMESKEFQLLHRAGQRPVRDIVAERQGSMEQRFGTARQEMDDSHTRAEGDGQARGVSRDGELFPVEERERAMASQGWGEQRTLPIIPDTPATPSGPRDEGDLGGKPR
jgi:hypothetical protein